MIEQQHYHMISIDPGSNLGVSIYTLNAIDHSIVNITTHTLPVNTYLDKDDNVNKLLNKSLLIQQHCLSLAKIYNPIFICVESAFANMRFPKAVIQLSQIINTIEMTFYTYNPMVKIFRYPPKYVKLCVGATGNADKDAMLLTVSEIKEISTHVDTSFISEHEIDSLAIGYTGILTVRTYPHLLYVF